MIGKDIKQMGFFLDKKDSRNVLISARLNCFSAVCDSPASKIHVFVDKFLGKCSFVKA